jgi:hypothetical protein
MSTLVITPLRVAIHAPEDSPLSGQSATWVEIEDQGAGAYLRVTQPWDDVSITLKPEEVPLLLEAARLVGVRS